MEGRSLPAEPADLADAEQHGRTMVNIRHPLIAVAPRSRGRLSHEHSGFGGERPRRDVKRDLCSPQMQALPALQHSHVKTLSVRALILSSLSARPSLQRALCSSARVASTRGRGIGVSVQSSSQCYKGSCTGSTDQTVNS
ncbi:hypothetical protein PF004_g6785 [Phytophthora fragariae]|uniref:Uncharacterized protein n=1 Tax=Phytophthora fragariae TaxID=53985 RepID=A0A6G0PBT4_9STRA|nr:hypothetical protein PF004_g6785 [Phytophthora fragariae]